MKSLRRSIAAFAAVCLLSGAAYADHADGTWKWVQQGRGGGGTPRETTLMLSVKDGKVTGKLTSPGRGGGDPVSTEISNASVKGDTVSFSVEREMGGNKVVSKYSGKLEGDTITGKYEAPGRDGQSQERDWVAKRSK